MWSLGFETARNYSGMLLTSRRQPHRKQREMIFGSFDLGITHFDLANNYGPPYGSAEINVGKILKSLPRDEILITSKAGYDGLTLRRMGL